MSREVSRRSLLATLAASAGCVGRGGTPTGTPTDEGETPGEGPTGTGASTATDEPTPTRTPVERREWPESYYQGPLVSAHEHMNGPDGFEMTDETMDWYVRWMDSNRVAQAMAITGPEYVPVVDGHDDRLIPFLFPWSEVRSQFDDLAATLARKLDEYPTYRGIGEFSLYAAPGPDGEPPLPANHPNLLAVYDLAADRDLPVMVHGGQVEQYGDPESPVADMEAALGHNRDCTFLVHGTFHNGVTIDGESDVPVGEAVDVLLDRHPNLYYDLSGQCSPYAYRYNEGPDDDGAVNPAETKSREWFESKLSEDGGVAYHARRLEERFRPILQNHSDRVLWGMDASWQWHYNDWTLDAWVDVARAMLGRLPEADARNVGYRTAEELFDVSVGDA